MKALRTALFGLMTVSTLAACGQSGPVGVGKVVFLADDLSDDSPASAIVASRGHVPYEPFGEQLWWTISNLLFLYTPAVLSGAAARNLALNRRRHPELVALTLELAQRDTLASAARSGSSLPAALGAHLPELIRVASSGSNFGRLD